MLYKTALEVHCSLYVHVIQRYITKDSNEHNILCITTTWLLSLETILFKTHYTVMSKTGSINPLLSSNIVSWSFCSEF